MLIDESAVIRSQMSVSEQLIWSGKPQQGFFLRGSDALLIPFSLIWCGFVIFWEMTVLKIDSSPIFPLFGIPFVLAGLYFLFGRFIFDIRQRKNTFYGISNERLIFVSGSFEQTVKSIGLAHLTDSTLKEHANNTGTIIFNDPLNAIADRDYISGRKYRPPPPTFERIPNAKNVYELIRNAQNKVVRY